MTTTRVTNRPKFYILWFITTPGLNFTSSFFIKTFLNEDDFMRCRVSLPTLDLFLDLSKMLKKNLWVELKRRKRTHNHFKNYLSKIIILMDRHVRHFRHKKNFDIFKIKKLEFYFFCGVYFTIHHHPQRSTIPYHYLTSSLQREIESSSSSN